MTEEVRRLRAALRAFVKAETEIAERSYREYLGDGRWEWNDTVWRRHDPSGFRLIVRARKALA